MLVHNVLPQIPLYCEAIHNEMKVFLEHLCDYNAELLISKSEQVYVRP